MTTHQRWNLGIFAFLLFLLMQEYSWADISAVPTSEKQQADSAVESDASGGEPEGSTEELIAGRGFQKFRYKGVFFAPGGFFDGTAIVRSANQNADVQSTFANILLQGSANSHLREFRGTARGSRINLLGEGQYRGTAIAGYVEVDFLEVALNTVLSRTGWMCRES